MKKRLKSLIPIIPLVALLFACDMHCNDCLELTSKSVSVQNSEGDNLVFGAKAIYNPNDFSLTTADGEALFFELDNQSGIIRFYLEEDLSTYYLNYSETKTDVLSFELTSRKSESCCGSVTYSSKTFLNSQEVDNKDLIVIVKQGNQ